MNLNLEEWKIRFQNRWSDILKDGDPFYNPNLSLKYPDFKLKKMSDFIEES